MNTRQVRLFLNKARRQQGEKLDFYPLVVLVNGKEMQINGIGIAYSAPDYLDPVVKIEIDY